MFTSRIPADRQAVVPAEILDALGLRAGDEIAFAIDPHGRVEVGRADDPFVNPVAPFTEWADDLDNAYDVLGRREGSA